MKEEKELTNNEVRILNLLKEDYKGFYNIVKIWVEMEEEIGICDKCPDTNESCMLKKIVRGEYKHLAN